MFNIGDYVVYGASGVCHIDSIGFPALGGMPKDKQYYTMSLVYDKGGKVFAPVDNEKVMIRHILTRKEAQELIDSIPDIEPLWVPEDKKRDAMFKDALKTYNCREWIRMIKALYIRRQSRLEEGKKITSNDLKYMKMAEDFLYGELAVALGVPRNEMEQYIGKRIDELDK